MMKRPIALAVMLSAVLAGAALGAYAIVSAQQGGDSATVTPISPVPTDQTQPAPLSAYTPNGCGDWPASSPDGPIATQYGEIRDCGLFDGVWVIATLGKLNDKGTRSGGVVALYDCNGDKPCLDNQTDHPLAGWDFVSPPFSGGVTIMNQLDVETLVFGVGNNHEGHAYAFNVVTRAFTLLAPATAEPATAATGASEALAQAPQPAGPTAGPDQIVFVGSVPAPAGTTITLQVMNLSLGLFHDCGTSITFSRPNDSATTSSFVVVLDGACIDGGDGAVVCWSPGTQDCALVATTPGSLPSSPATNVALLTQRGITFDTGLLVRPRVVPPNVPPEGDNGPVGSALPATGTSDSRQGSTYGWLLWAGLATLGLGLSIAGGGLFAARRR